MSRVTMKNVLEAIQEGNNKQDDVAAAVAALTVDMAVLGQRMDALSEAKQRQNGRLDKVEVQVQEHESALSVLCEKVQTQSGKWGWLLGVVTALGQALIIYLLTKP